MVIRMLTEEVQLKNHLRGIVPSDWQRLFDLIPKVENATQFGKWDTANVTAPYVMPSEEVNLFFDTVYDLGLIVVFDWGSWEEGFKAWKQKAYNFHQMTLPQLCKMLTLLVRGDRFHEGLLVEAFERGLILNILKAIRAKTPFH